jgi:lysophospholipase L1-like esterase
MQWLSFPDPNCQVCGFPWFSETAPMLWRFPERMKARLQGSRWLYEAGQQTAGGRLRFRTDTGSISLKARFPEFSLRTNMTQYTVHGISTYVDGRCWSARIPGAEGGEAELSLFDGVPRQMRDVCLYLPLYGPVEVLSIGVDEDAGFESPAPFALEKPVLFYGTSITQGGNASRPGLSYQAVLARDLNLDYANYGFAGKGRCEREVAEVLAEVDTSCYVLDVGQNTSVEALRERFEPFMDTLREAQPQTPLLATTPIFNNSELWSEVHQQTVGEKRDIIRSAVQDRKQAGDQGIHLLEAADFLGTDFTDSTVDGGHPNDLGFAQMANGMKPKLAEILGL